MVSEREKNMTSHNSINKILFEEYGVQTEEQLESVLKDDWKTIPCMGCGKSISVESDKYVWVLGDPYHKGCV